LQLIECIELLKNDVKKKMMICRAIVACTKVTAEHHRRFFAGKISAMELCAAKNCAASPASKSEFSRFPDLQPAHSHLPDLQTGDRGSTSIIKQA
jgi:hypothetical protein